MTLEIRPSSDPSVYNLYVNGYLAVSEQSREVCETIASNLRSRKDDDIDTTNPSPAPPRPPRARIREWFRPSANPGMVPGKEREG